MPSAAIIELTAAQRNRIKKLARSQRMPHRTVVRARIVQLAARGLPNATIAGRLSLCSCSAKSCRPTTSPTCTKSNGAWPTSNTATTHRDTL